MLPLSSIIYLTNNCELDCTHCFVKNKSKTINLEYNKLVEVLEDFHSNNVYMVAFTGGDPHLYPNLIDILNKTYDLGMLPLLGISGIGIDEDFIYKLSLCNLGCIQISIDGSNDEINSLIRGKGTFDKIINNINLMNKYNIRVNIATCIHKDNFNDYKNILNLFKELGAYNIKLQFFKKLNSTTLEEITYNQKKK